jgi:hypothetical protein
MKYLPILCLVLTFTVSGYVFARIGKTQEQVTALYGKSVDPGTSDK